MASVSSLDHDMRKLRLDRYTPQAANEVRGWIEEVLGERLVGGDLMNALKDGVALCKLVNLIAAPGVKYKRSSMPFVQMENISHFLRACEMPPLNLPSHDRFLTVDLYDSKDPAQVLQCIGAFSRRANATNPSRFPRTIGAKSKGSAMSPQLSGSSQGGYGRAPGSGTRNRTMSNNSDNSATAFNSLVTQSYSGRVSPTKSTLSMGGLASPGPVSSWSKKDDEVSTAPAWNIHQYGYMGGASQGNQGISFGSRRQLTSAAPQVPSLAEKERRRQEEAAEEERRRLQAEDEERQRRAAQEAEEERARAEEERKWEEETRRMREKERRDAEEEKRTWDEEQRRWKAEEDARVKEEKELEARLASERTRARGTSDARLNGQFLSQYRADQNQTNKAATGSARTTSESQQIQELERQLREAKEREQEYERERQARMLQAPQPAIGVTWPASPPAPALPSRPSAPQANHEDEGDTAERDYLKKEWQNQQNQTHVPTPPHPPRLTPAEPAAPTSASRPLADPSNYTPGTNRTDRYLSSNPAPAPAQTASHRPADYSTTTEVDLENQRRKESQAKTKAGGWASKSLLEREMERERERQREWEEGVRGGQPRLPEIRRRGRVRDRPGMCISMGIWAVIIRIEADLGWAWGVPGGRLLDQDRLLDAMWFEEETFDEVMVIEYEIYKYPLISD